MPGLPSRPPLPLFSTNTSAVDCISASATVRYRVHCVIFFCPVWPSFCHCSSFGITTPSSCMMIDAVMYGMIPSEEDGRARERAAGEQVEEADRRRRCRSTLPSAASRIAWKSTYGTGMCDPNRKIATMKIVKKILFRRSGTRNMFARRLRAQTWG